MANDYYGPQEVAVPGTTVRSQQFNNNNGGVEGGFDKLPTPANNQTAAHRYAVDTGAVENAYEITLDFKNQVTDYIEGMEVSFLSAKQNTGPATLSVNGLSPKLMVTSDNFQLTAGSIVTDTLISAQYDGTSFRVTNAVFRDIKFDTNEEQTLAADQTTVTFAVVSTTGTSYYVEGQLIDRGRLLLGEDYTITNTNTIELLRFYPAGTKILAAQNEANTNDNLAENIYESVFNRRIVQVIVGASYKQYEDDGRDLTPRLLYSGNQFTPLETPPAPADPAWTFTGPVVDNNDGTIDVPTSDGVKVFNKVNAEAVGRSEVNDSISLSSGGLILPKSDQSVELNQDLTGASFVKFQGGDYPNLTTFKLAAKDGSGFIASGSLTSFSLTGELEATIGGVDYWLIISTLESSDHVDASSFGVTGGALVSKVKWSAKLVNPSLVSIVNGSAVNEVRAMQACLDYAVLYKINKVNMAGIYVAISPGTATLRLPDNIDLDCQGGGFIRIGTNFDKRTVENYNWGTATINDNITLRNCFIKGTGDTVSVSDQGSGLGLFGVENFRVENYESETTNGDGFQLRAASGTMKNIRIGSYGRNGISPTSGVIYYDDVYVLGPALAGADPGFGFDSEINNPTEISEHYISGLVSNTAVFVDLITTVPDEKFAIKVRMENSTIGPFFRSLRFQSTVTTTDAEIHVDASNTVICGVNNDGRAIEINNVSGGTIDSCKIYGADGTASARSAIRIIKKAEDWTINYPSIEYDNLTYTLFVFDSGIDEINDSIMNFREPPAIILRGSGNQVKSKEIASISIRGASSIGNIIDSPTVGSITFSDGALVDNQYGRYVRSSASGLESPPGNYFFTKSENYVASSNFLLTVPLPGTSKTFKAIVQGGTSDGNYAYAEFLFYANGNTGTGNLIDTFNASQAGSPTISFTSVTSAGVNFSVFSGFGGEFTATIIG